MRRHLRQVEHDLGRVVGVGIGLRRCGDPARDHRLGEAVGDAPGGERRGSLAQEERGRVVEREPADECAPLGGHVGDRHPLRDRQAGDAGAVKLDRRVEHLARVVEAAQREDDVLADHAAGERALEDHLDRSAAPATRCGRWPRSPRRRCGPPGCRPRPGRRTCWSGSPMPPPGCQGGRSRCRPSTGGRYRRRRGGTRSPARGRTPRSPRTSPGCPRSCPGRCGRARTPAGDGSAIRSAPMLRNLASTALVLSWVMTWRGRIVTMSPARTSWPGDRSTACAWTIFSVMVWLMDGSKGNLLSARTYGRPPEAALG